MPTGSAAELHARAVAEAERGRHAVALRLLQAALKRDPEATVRARVLLSLAFHEAERRSLDAGLALLDEADAMPDLPRPVRGLVAGQRGLLNMRAGRAVEALAGFHSAEQLLDESMAEDLCRALLNRGMLHLRYRTLPAARDDFTRCLDVGARRGHDVLAAKASHNLGYLSMLAGDIPRALQQMDIVGPVLGSLSPAHAAVCHADRAQVLLTAGLLREADDDLARAAELLGVSRLRQDQAEVSLARAQVALLAERWADARRLAVRARRLFRSRGADTWVLLAEQAIVSSDVGAGHRLRAAADAGTALAPALASVGLYDEARRAALTAATALLRCDDVDLARVAAGTTTTLWRTDPLATRLQAREVRAGLADSAPRADAELRAAVLDLHRYQASFGSLDLQTAASTLGRRLAGQGLATALAGGRPAAVFAWAERARALSTRLAPVVPPEDENVARLLTELRLVRVELREQELAGRVDQAARTRRSELERLLRQRSWYRQGSGQLTAPVPLRALQDHLVAAGATFVAHLLVEGRIHALVADARRRSLHSLGPAAPALELRHRVRADLDALATRRLPDRMRAAVQVSAATSLRRLEALLWTPLRKSLRKPLGSEIGDGPLLLAPSAALATAPWTLLPALRSRPLSVVASATAWVTARQRVHLPARPRVVLVAGPGVPQGEREVRRIAAEWPQTEVLVGDTATPDAVCRAAAVADVLHVAAHGTHEPDNPLFSNLALHGGPLFGYELDQLPRLPAHIVLSSCELGLAETRPGDETLGMTAALLHGGAGSVVAGVARISDDLAARVGAAHHAGLCRGIAPAAALAAALAMSSQNEPVPLVCFGL